MATGTLFQKFDRGQEADAKALADQKGGIVILSNDKLYVESEDAFLRSWERVIYRAKRNKRHA